MILIISYRKKPSPNMFDMCFQKTSVKKNKKTSECTNKEWMKMEIYFISDSWKLLFFCWSEDKNISFWDKKLSFVT